MMLNTKLKYEINDSVEEQFIWLLRFATVRKIKDFLTKVLSIDLHYPTPNLKTPITAAIDRGDLQILSFLLERNSTGLDNAVTQPWGRTALMYASYVSKNPELLQVLLKKGADLQKVDIRGWSCLQYAIVGERPTNVKFLLDSGVYINQKDAQGRTPLMISVYRSNFHILSILLDHGADVNVRDNRSFTALQIAIFWRKRDAAITLIERGSDVSVVTPITKATIGELCRTSMPNILRCLEPKRYYSEALQ
ncbi:fibronectin type 3 and ankyrin repeat domains protein 1-like [Frieseomelitta varia]|uniref:fibronectin type 3 and ankyrin repeat domains protein 1-like n=1 Tax=Frieseomelitta varia TaxID=561572 RepID=UPI001CB68031|nr:fibronectin type 3 and ankyrin repeat domains protein 1-like [Frieseomelitta varia]